KSSIVLCSQGNYSDAHCFPWAYKEMGIGKLVGMPVAGTCSFVWWERLQDPSLVFGIPNMGVYDMRGAALENQELQPDIKVENDWSVLGQGRDLQLEKAVESLLSQLN
ncbi:MAG: hypothetical protein KDC71_23590, partial [Acidobacteria bacterium]|nr:hypothetical protein [Acidobacteriota bacterium]